MKKGKIKWYSEDKGYGFIITDMGEDIFVHRSGFSSNYGYISDDQRVIFDVQRGDKGLTAINVKQDS
jgi:CspA family cold shock protein